MSVCKTAALITVIAVSLIGCGETKVKRIFIGTSGYTFSDRFAGMVYGQSRPTTQAQKNTLDKYLQIQMRRLTTAGWEEGWMELKVLGVPAVESLVSVIGDETPTYSPRNASPGISYRAVSAQLTLGELAYALLKEMLQQYSNYTGPLPSNNAAEWKQWWETNSRSLKMTSRILPTLTDNN